MTAYYGLFHTHLNYAILAWGHSAHTAEVFAMQRKCVRIIMDMGFRADCRCAFVSLGILTVPSLYIFASLLYIINNLPLYSTGAHEYETRYRNNLVPEYHRLYRSRQATNHYGLKFFNVLPRGVRELPVAQFTGVIKGFLLRGAFYSVEEYLLKAAVTSF